jgi:hypothetical protein
LYWAKVGAPPVGWPVAIRVSARAIEADCAPASRGADPTVAAAASACMVLRRVIAPTLCTRVLLMPVVLMTFPMVFLEAFGRLDLIKAAYACQSNA